MHVLHVIPSLSPVHGGPSFALPLMERALHHAGVDVTVVTTDDDGFGAHADVPLGRAVTVNGATRFYFRRQTEFYKVSWPLHRWLAAHVAEYDVVHIHALFSFTSWAAARACLGPRSSILRPPSRSQPSGSQPSGSQWSRGQSSRVPSVPYLIRPLGVLNRWGMENRRRLLKSLSFRFVERRILRRAAAMHYTSEQEHAEARALGVTTRAHVIPLGLDLAPFQSLPGPERFHQRWPKTRGREIILFLSRLNAVKGLDLLLDAFAEVKQRRAAAMLVIAGSGDEMFVRSLRERAQRLGVSDDVVWTGFLADEAKREALAAARVFVLPSYSENFGIAAVEALAAGVPTVVTETVGIADDVKRAQAGLVTPAGCGELAEALSRVLSQPELARQWSANARALTRERFSLEAMGAGLKGLYGEISGRDGFHPVRN